MEFPRTGYKNLNLKTTDDCGNETRGVRQVVIVQNLLAGQYINVAESGDTATISADISADYYDKVQIHDLLADIDTVSFKVVASLPTQGLANVIYLVEKTAPDVGYDQFIWNTVDRVFEPIGDTDIDLSEYYTKTQSDGRYYQKSEVYNKTESDTRYYQKTETYNKTETDALLDEKQDKLTTGVDPTPADSVTLSSVDLSTKKVTKVSLLGIWNYIKGKFGGSMVSPVVDSTRISGIDSSQSNIHSYFSASALWDYIVTKATQAITASATHLQIPSAKAVLDFVQARRRYQHTLVRYNNDSKQYPMGWVIIVTNNATETYASFAKWLYDNNYRSPETSYWHCGGCCGTTGVRNQADTGTAYIGRVTSGVYSTDGTTMMFKYDYNGTVSIIEARSTVYTEPFLKPLS